MLKSEFAASELSHSGVACIGSGDPMQVAPLCIFWSCARRDAEVSPPPTLRRRYCTVNVTVSVAIWLPSEAVIVTVLLPAGVPGWGALLPPHALVSRQSTKSRLPQRIPRTCFRRQPKIPVMVSNPGKRIASIAPRLCEWFAVVSLGAVVSIFIVAAPDMPVPLSAEKLQVAPKGNPLQAKVRSLPAKLDTDKTVETESPGACAERVLGLAVSAGGGGLTAIDKFAAAVAAGDAESVNWTVKLPVPACAGVPEITPVVPFRVIPDGRLPELTLQR